MLVPKEQARLTAINGDILARLKFSRPKPKQSPARMTPEERAAQKHTPPSRD
jgi:hypothetical protein